MTMDFKKLMSGTDFDNLDWIHDIKRLKNYKIEEQFFTNTNIKKFIECVYKSNSTEDVKTCKQDLPREQLDNYGLKYKHLIKIEAVGDFRCSGKSDFVHLLDPDSAIEFGEEEDTKERGSFSRDKQREIITTSTSRIQNDKEDNNVLLIYVKRNIDEKIKCLLNRRKQFIYKNKTDQEIKEDAIKDVNRQRDIILPQIYNFKNYMVVNNTNID